MISERLQNANRYVNQRLANELHPRLYYHNRRHTIEDVFNTASDLAIRSNLDLTKRDLLLTAVLFHDLAWVNVQGNSPEDYARAHEHEVQGAAIARQVLPAMDYSTQEIDQVEKLILATRVPQQPGNLLERLIVDADMSSIGRVNFWITSMALREELAAFGHFIPEIDWYWRQYHLLRNFTFFSDPGCELFDNQRLVNIHAIRARLELLGASVD